MSAVIAAMHTVDVSPPERSLEGGSADEPELETVTAMMPVSGLLAGLTVDASGEVGVRIDRSGGNRVFPAETDALGGHLFLSNWPPSVGLGRPVSVGEEFTVNWARIEAGSVDVRAFLQVAEVQR